MKLKLLMESLAREGGLIRKRSGSALILALMAFMILSAVGLMVSLTVTEDFDITRNYVEAIQCLYITEAGLNYALSELTYDSGWTGLSLPGRTVGRGYFTVAVSDSTAQGSPLPSGQKRINVKAKISLTEREIEVIAQ